MREEPEQDTGYVTLTHVKNKNNEFIETTDKDGVWAWKHPHHDGTLTYTPLKGEIEFCNVDFGYDDKN